MWRLVGLPSRMALFSATSLDFLNPATMTSHAQVRSVEGPATFWSVLYQKIGFTAYPNASRTSAGTAVFVHAALRNTAWDLGQVLIASNCLNIVSRSVLVGASASQAQVFKPNGWSKWSTSAKQAHKN